jgi:hypothetical protein
MRQMTIEYVTHATGMFDSALCDTRQRCRSPKYQVITVHIARL